MAKSSSAQVDEIIATLLADCMGWKSAKDSYRSIWETSSGKYMYAKEHWTPTTDLEQALEVISYLNMTGFLLSITQNEPGFFQVNVISREGVQKGASCYRGDSVALLICKAALSVLHQRKLLV